MTREEQINKEKTYNQLTELLGAIDKQPKSIEVVLDKRQLNIAEEANKRYLGRLPHQYYSIVDLARAFRDGAEWADNHSKSPWISVEDDLPYKHKELLSSEVGKTTEVFIISNSGVDYCFMEKVDGEWQWDSILFSEPTHWMPVPKLNDGEKVIEVADREEEEEDPLKPCKIANCGLYDDGECILGAYNFHGSVESCTDYINKKDQL